ncbi:MAG TPA: nicotinate (nicotinamide) nucleotide adenylyltransferase, partial [Flavobacteriales bacterium]|nr:nicotinate (nicotinamide) nucleotide adenylyltransferase [Flavobacteriales bacterium]
IAEHMLRTQGLEAVWLVVTPLNPFKQHQPISPDAHRLAMVKLATQGHPGLETCDFELGLPQPNYTVDTLRAMRLRWPEHAFCLIIGSDNLQSLHRWKDPDEILAHHGVLVYPRPGADMHGTMSPFHGHARIHLITDAPVMDTSSTKLRELVGGGALIGNLVAPSVAAYIREHGLYRS